MINYKTNIYNLTYKDLILNGTHLGGNLQHFDLSCSSVSYGIRTKNIIIDSTFTSAELLKSLKSVEHLGFNRKTFYYIYSSLASKTLFKNLYNYQNVHLSFFSLKTLQPNFRFRRSIFSKIFMSSNWYNGFLTNRTSFKMSFFNEKKMKRLFSNEKKVKNYYDKIPRIPQYAFIHNATQSILQEFFSLKISHANSGDVYKPSVFKKDSSIPSNSISFYTSNFYLIVFLSTYLFGLYKKIILFRKSDFEEFNLKRLNFKKKIFFKKYFFFKFIS